jgi:hypothetical protein
MLKLDQLVSEYRVLRASVLRLWEQTEIDDKGEITGDDGMWGRMPLSSRRGTR